uniref:Uncharacterized protein n=1 Tax=Romanomermis culicivorax TaxID=13658 RepID=A0A915IK87_ROMCU
MKEPNTKKITSIKNMERRCRTDVQIKNKDWRYMNETEESKEGRLMKRQEIEKKTEESGTKKTEDPIPIWLAIWPKFPHYMYDGTDEKREIYDGKHK